MSTKNTQHYKVLTSQEEMVSNADRRMDFSDCADNTCDIEIGAMHLNVGNSLPNAHNTKKLQSLMDIAMNTDQSSKIMNFPSIDHDSPVKWVLLLQTIYSYYEYFVFSHTLLTANITIQNKSLSTHIHGCFLVELVMYMALNEGRYPSKSGDSIYCNIMMVDSLMTACLVYLCTILSSDIQITERVISSSTLTDSLGKTHRLWNNWKDSWKTKIQNI